MTLKIGIVVFDGIIPFHLSVPYAVFEKALTPTGAPFASLSYAPPRPARLKPMPDFQSLSSVGLISWPEWIW